MQGKVAIITASSTGIGKAIAIKLAQKGVKVIISSRNIKNITQTVDQLKLKGYQAHGIVCHVGKKQDRERLLSQTIQKYGRIDYLIPNAAVNLVNQSGFMHSTEEQIQKMYDINFKSTFLLIQSALPHLKKNKGSSIVFNSSSMAYEPNNRMTHYGITKIMLVLLAKSLSRLLINDQIRVNCVSPGLIKTEFSKRLWGNQKFYNQQVKPTLGMNKRMGTPQEVANVVCFLLSDQGSYINGQSIFLSGKPSARL